MELRLSLYGVLFHCIELTDSDIVFRFKRASAYIGEQHPLS